jgi:hypothetical protein
MLSGILKIQIFKTYPQYKLEQTGKFKNYVFFHQFWEDKISETNDFLKLKTQYVPISSFN